MVTVLDHQRDTLTCDPLQSLSCLTCCIDKPVSISEPQAVTQTLMEETNLTHGSAQEK